MNDRRPVKGRRGAPGAGDAPEPKSQGQAARDLAVTVIGAVIDQGRALDETLDRTLAGATGLDDRDGSLVRAIATVGIRHFGAIRSILMERMRDGMPGNSGPLGAILVAATAQLLWLDVPDHAAVALAVDGVRADKRAERYASLANAVLRRIARERDAVLAGIDPLRDETPAWLRQRWTDAYGGQTAQRIAAAHSHEPSVDISLKADPALWAERLDALLLPTGSLRLRSRASVASLPGYSEGGWWVQDAAAALPARLLGVRPGDRVADLCAAPGGKTAQLAAAGAQVLAVDRAEGRLARLSANMERLGLAVETRAMDALQLEGEFDAVLLDAPCSATGTLRRHPDVAWTKGDTDVARLAALQRRLLDKAATLVRPGGRIVFCTCSLEPDEGEQQVRSLLERHPELRRLPVEAAELPGLEEAVTADGDVRTLPFMLPNEQPRLAGIDGFYIARLERAVA
jgi:16S rRNA (cytosine967-C5)-methyltransferase